MYGIKVCKRAPVIGHTLFAEDSCQFFRATHNETRALQSILDVYAKASGQAINIQKSENLLYHEYSIYIEALDMIHNINRDE